MSLYYDDDIESDIVTTVQRVLEYIEVDVPAQLNITVHQNKQADAQSEALLQLFSEEMRARCLKPYRVSELGGNS